MNLKRKLWWAQHRTDVYKYGTILSLVLIVTISIIYFTYSKFSSTNEMTMYETTVEPFIKNDDFIASYIDGEWSNEIPGKDDGYVVDKIVCDNGATGTWDNDEWGINIRNAIKKIKCGVYFKKLVRLTEQITTLASTDTTNFASDDPDNNIRYIGASPNNYVYFNCSDYSNQSDSTCEKWRIIGVFKNMTKEDGTKEDLVKIIRNDFIDNILWDNHSYTTSGKYSYEIRQDQNDWPTATLQTTLNGEYYNGTYATGALKNDTTRNAIESVVWNLGGADDVISSMFYESERGTTVYSGHATTWTGKIGLMYPSDYGYATSGNSTTDRATCLAKELSNWHKASDCYSNDYLFNSGYNQWALTPFSSNINYGAYVYYDGRVLFTNVFGAYGVRPTAFLKSNISISSGDGSSSTPYNLKLN